MNFLNKARKKAEQAFNEIQGVALNKPPQHGQSPYQQPQGYGAPPPQNVPPPPSWQAHQFPELLQDHPTGPYTPPQLQPEIFYPPPPNHTPSFHVQSPGHMSPHSPPQPQVPTLSYIPVPTPQSYGTQQPQNLGQQHQDFSPHLNTTQSFPITPLQPHLSPIQQPGFPPQPQSQTQPQPFPTSPSVPQPFSPQLHHTQSFTLQPGQSFSLQQSSGQQGLYQQPPGLQSPHSQAQPQMIPQNFPQPTASPSYPSPHAQNVTPQQQQGFSPPLENPHGFSPGLAHTPSFPAQPQAVSPPQFQPQVSSNPWNNQSLTPPLTDPQSFSPHPLPPQPQVPYDQQHIQTFPPLQHQQSFPPQAHAYIPPLEQRAFSSPPRPPQIPQNQQHTQSFHESLGNQQASSPPQGHGQLPQPQQQGFSPPSSQPQIPQHVEQTLPPPLSHSRQFSSAAAPPISPSLPQQSLECQASTEGAPTKYIPFYVLTSSSACSVCKNCYLSKVAPYPYMAAQFTLYTGLDEQFICDMSYPRVQSTFLNVCVPQNTVQPLIDFGILFPSLIPCTGGQITSSGPMYTTKNQIISGFAICSTCYELFIHRTAFDQHFERIVYNEMQEWNCDLHNPFFKRVLLASFPAGDFSTLVEEANGRINLGSCPGKGQPIGPLPGTEQYLVFTAKGGKTGNICPGCYCDYVAYTPFADEFVAANLGHSQAGSIRCDLASPYSKVAMRVAIKKKSDEVWRKVLGLDDSLPPCPGAQGVDEELLGAQGENEIWYQMISYPNIECCPRCYFLFVELFGAAHLFNPISRPLTAGVIRQCVWTESSTPADTPVTDPNNFENTATWRGRMLRNCLGLSYSTGDYTDLLKVAEILNASPPPCAGRLRGFKSGSGRNWYGRIAQDKSDPNDTTIVFCAECHNELVDSTPLESLLSTDLSALAYSLFASDPKGFFCQPYSARSKSMLKEACVKGDLGLFARYWNNREELRKKREAWQPVLAAQDAKQKGYNRNLASSVQAKVNAQKDALGMIGASMVHEAAMGETGVRYGNSVIGMDHLTAGRANAEMAFHNASNMAIGGGGGDVMSESRRLLALFEKDNQAYLAVE